MFHWDTSDKNFRVNNELSPIGFRNLMVALGNYLIIKKDLALSEHSGCGSITFSTGLRVHSVEPHIYVEGTLCVSFKVDMFGMPYVAIANFLPYVERPVPLFLH